MLRSPPTASGGRSRVGTLVQGTVAQSGDRLRVSVSLVNAANGEEIGSTDAGAAQERDLRAAGRPGEGGLALPAAAAGAGDRAGAGPSRHQQHQGVGAAAAGGRAQQGPRAAARVGRHGRGRPAPGAGRFPAGPGRRSSIPTGSAPPDRAGLARVPPDRSDLDLRQGPTTQRGPSGGWCMPTAPCSSSRTTPTALELRGHARVLPLAAQPRARSVQAEQADRAAPRPTCARR